MTFEQLLFYIFSAGLILSGVMVIVSRNPVRCALFLVAAFVMSAALWILLEAEFLALVLILVYVGAVITLFMFVVMMLNIDVADKQVRISRRLLAPAIIAVAFTVGIMLFVIGPEHFGLASFASPVHEPANYSNVKELGLVLYTHYVYPFELAAVILLVAMISAISLNFRGKRFRKSQNVPEQVMVRPEERVRMVKMKVEDKQ